MFLTQLNELNKQVKEQLRSARMRTIEMEAGQRVLPRMEFLKADHSMIPTEVPTHKINVIVDSHAHKTPADCANNVVKFVLDSANEFSQPRIHMSHVYLNYNPKAPVSDYCTLAFDIAIWEYDGAELAWLQLGREDQFRLGHDIGAFQFPDLRIAKVAHQLLKTEAFEINLWKANIARDISYITDTRINALQYVLKLEHELLAGAAAAAEEVRKLQRAAQAHDVVVSYFRVGKPEDALTVINEMLDTDAEVYEAQGVTYIMLDTRLYRPEQTFALVAGLTAEYVEYVDVQEPIAATEPLPEGVFVTPAATGPDFWTYRDSDETDLRAKAIALGISPELLELDTPGKQMPEHDGVDGEGSDL
jgi:hypothetical protein